MNCPTCGSTRVKKLSMVYLGGTTDNVSFGRRGARYSQRSSRLAKSAAPPGKPWNTVRMIWWMILASLACLLTQVAITSILANYGIDSKIQAYLTRYNGLTGIAVALLVLVFGVTRARNATRRYSDAAASYDTKWLCEACGSTLISD